MKHFLLTLCLYMAHVGCQQQQHEQRMSATTLSITGNHGSQLPDQKMSSSLETVVLVPLSHIDSILPFESFKSFTYVPPQANASTTINSMEPTATESHTEQPIHAAAAAQASVNLNNTPSNAAVLAKLDAKSSAQIPSKTSTEATNLPNNSKPVSLPSAANEALPPPPPPPPPAAAAAQANDKVKAAALNAAASPAASVTTVTATVTESVTTTATVTLSYEDAADKRMKSCYRKNRKVPFSQYWIPKENEWDETNDGKRVFLGGNEKVKLNDAHNKPLGEVTALMYDKCKMEGTCLLDNGDLINIDNTTDNFIKVGGRGREHNVFGLGSGAQNLVPYISVAVNDIPYGQKLYISKLDGVDLGYGIKHNGCVRVDDDSWSFESCQIDFFVLSYVDYLWLDLEDEVSIKYAECELKNYVTAQHLALVKATSNEKIIPSLMNATYKH
ncbi:hypothetical protein MAM1_0033d02506 [Mucor ambiguus]|uniref:Uncharacterized protein n=1 Tax=Mucor ambiguus TaxID=91626 RepID=A0A0C9LSQ2_9FUNG|nr:hypothetical protein MAM1_0033d02506 [Mucor ambiguus]